MIRKYWLALSWTALIAFLLCIPGSQFPRGDIPVFSMENMDKVIHYFLFFVSQVLWLRPLRHAAAAKFLRRNFATAALLILFGIAMEFVQDNFIPLRSFEVADIFADATGVLAGVAYLQFVKRRRERTGMT